MIARRKRPRSGILRGPKRSWPKHEQFVRSLVCAVPHCATGDRIEFAHLRTAANAGTGLKPHSAYGVPLCATHHAEQHRVGMETFQRRHKIDLFAIAAELVRRSPDWEMRESLNERPPT